MVSSRLMILNFLKEAWMNKYILLKIIWFAPVLLLPFLFSCSEKENPVSQYGDAMINSYSRGKTAGEEGNLNALKSAIAAYRASYDRNPGSLDELQELLTSPLDLSKYEYDPETGAVSRKRE
jgi:hypothetical protein